MFETVLNYKKKITKTKLANDRDAQTVLNSFLKLGYDSKNKEMRCTIQ